MQYDIRQIIDLAIFRELLERFTKLTKVATAILDLQGNVLLRGHWVDICTKFHRVHPETRLRCQESDTILANSVKSGTDFNVYSCKNGLIDVAVPIVIDGSHVGNIFAGQFFTEAPDIDFFKRQAAQYGFEERPYLDALSRVPVLSEDEVLNTVKFFSQVAVVIGQLGIARMKLTKANRRLKNNFDAARKALGKTAVFNFDNIVCHNKKVKTVVARAKKAANSPSTILLTGESGTGKEVFAQAIHNASDREGGPFIPINCGAIPKELIQSELFGYEAGAFTGADRKGRMGKFEIANGGTLFLDEIGDMPLKMQVNLLRVIADRSITRVGGSKQVPVDVRLIAATNQNLLDEIEKGNFREDLYYRLNVVPFRLPPLRERPEDVIPLAEYHLSRTSSRLGKYIHSIHREAKDALLAYSWPGNIREVRNAIEQAVNMAQGDTILLDHLPEYILNQENRAVSTESHERFRLSELEKETIGRALRHYKGNITNTSKALGIGRTTLYDKMKKYRIK